MEGCVNSSREVQRRGGAPTTADKCLCEVERGPGQQGGPEERGGKQQQMSHKTCLCMCTEVQGRRGAQGGPEEEGAHE